MCAEERCGSGSKLCTCRGDGACAVMCVCGSEVCVRKRGVGVEASCARVGMKDARAVMCVCGSEVCVPD